MVLLSAVNSDTIDKEGIKLLAENYSDDLNIDSLKTELAVF